VRDLRMLDFLVTGRDPMPGMIFVSAQVNATVETGSRAA
jgi:hypothetical protein